MFKDPKARLCELIESSLYGGAFFGIPGGNGNMNIAELLIGSNDLSLRPDMENINGILCYVVEGTSRYGKITAWIAPDKGYSPAKWIMQKGPNDLQGDIPAGMHHITDFEVTDFEQQATAFIPKKAILIETSLLSDGSKDIWRFSYEISDIQLNPDFGTMGAFMVNLPEGTRIILSGSPGIKFIWKNGKVTADVNQVDFDKIDKAIEHIKQQ